MEPTLKLNDCRTDHTKKKCPVENCTEAFHLWEVKKLLEHLNHYHQGYLVQYLREQGLYAEASEVSRGILV